MKSVVRQLLLWILVITGVIALFTYVSHDASQEKVLLINYSEMLNQTQAGHVKDVTITGTTMTGHYTSGVQFRTTIPDDPGMYPVLMAHGVSITAKDQNSNYWVSLGVTVAPFFLLLGLWFVLLRHFQRTKANRTSTGTPGTV